MVSDHYNNYNNSCEDMCYQSMVMMTIAIYLTKIKGCYCQRYKWRATTRVYATLGHFGGLRYLSNKKYLNEKVRCRVAFDKNKELPK